jgi:hypothetical protein
VTVGDYDNDGFDDIFITYYGHNVLYHNNGDGTFSDVTDKAGLGQTAVRHGSGCTWVDYDRDGRLDLFVATYLNITLEKLPAAYLLVAVDLLLSHWPKSRVAAITESGSQRRSRLRQLSGRDSCQTWLG